MPEVYLSDEGPCDVRRLGIFELDNIVPEKAGPFTYIIKDLTGEEHEVPFRIEDFDEPPEKPDVPESEIVEGSSAWYELYDWQLYQASIEHKRQQMIAVADYYERVTYYILDNCVAPEDRKRIVTEGDWERVYTAALVPQLSMTLIKDTLRTTYGAQFQGQELFDAIEALPKGKGAYNSIRKWENQLTIELKMTEIEYALLPLEERARKICALIIDDIMGSLEAEVRRKELDAKRKN